MKDRRSLKNKGWSILEVSPSCHPTRTEPPLSAAAALLSRSIAWYQLTGIGVAVGTLRALGPTPHILSLPLSSLRFQGRLRGGRWLDPLQESRRLAPLPQHLPGVVCDCAGGRLVQRRGDGTADVRDPALHLKSLLRWEKGKRPSYYQGEKRSRERTDRRGSIFHILTSYLLYITMCHIGDMVMWCHFLYIKEIYIYI